MATQTISDIVKGSNYTVPNLPSDWSKAGYSFSYWNTAADGSGANYYPGDTITMNENTALYAQWIQQ